MKHIAILLFGLITITACASSDKINKENKSADNQNEEPVAAPSFYQEKFINGTDFFARGNEPFWTLEIDLEKEMKFITLDDINLTIPAVEGVKAQDADVTRFHAQTESGEMMVTLIKENCEDNMSGEPFNYKVKVEVRKSIDENFKTYEGCGSYLFDYRLNDIWVMEEMTGVELKKEELIKGIPTFEFNLKEMRFNGHAGCNNLTGKIDLRGTKINFGNIAATMMACPDMEVERAVIDALNKKTFTYKIENPRLTLDNDSRVKIVFKKAD